MRELLTLCAVLSLVQTASAETFEIRAGDDLFARLGSLAPGDEVIVFAGTYATGGFLELDLAGTAAAPILVRAADGERPVIEGVRSQNVINLSGSYFTLRGFDIRGGSHGLRLASVDHVRLEDLTLHDLGDVGISCNRSGNTCDHLVVRRNEIYDTGVDGGPGEGMYLGCNNAACVISNSTIEQNYIHDIGGSQGDGIELKTGSFGNVVRDNVIIGANYPAITMYGFESGAANIVERNFIWGTTDNGIQVVGQVVVRNNIILDAGQNGIHSKASQGFAPHDLEIVHNTVWNAGAACMKTNDWSGQAGQLIANNAFYCEGGLAVDVNGGAPAATFASNVTLGDVRAAGGGFAAGMGSGDLGDPSGLVFYPPMGSPLINAGDPSHAPADDFDLGARSDGLPDVGAYEVTTPTNPGWMLGSDFKGSEGGGTPGVDAGVPAADGGLGTDGGAPRADGGSMTGDGGSGPRVDGGADGGSGEGCACSVQSSKPPRLAGILGGVVCVALLLWRRRCGAR